MSQVPGVSPSQTPISTPSILIAPRNLEPPAPDGSILSIPEKTTKVDDKAAALENELSARSSRFNKERFAYYFAIITLVDALVGSFVPTSVFLFLIVASIILLIGLANWLEFPWVITHLVRWLNLLERKVTDKAGGAEKTES